MRAAERVVLPFITFVALLTLWQAVAYLGPYSRILFPAPADVLKGAFELLGEGKFWGYVGVSLARFAAGYLTAALVAIPIGLLFGWYSRLWTAVDPLVQLLRPISPIAWFPLISLWFGIGDLPAIVIIFIAAFYPILLSTVAAVRQVDPVFLKVAGNFGASEKNIVTRVVIPASFPYIAMGLHIAVGTAWVFLVAGEMLGVRSGLGYLIIDSRNFLRTDLVLVGVIVIGLFGLLMDKTIGMVERWVKMKHGQG